MSTKKIHLYNMAFQRLEDQCVALRRGVTAGEYAKYMGIARSTAVRWLADMLKEGAIACGVDIARNHQLMTLWQPENLNDTLAGIQRYRREMEENE